MTLPTTEDLIRLRGEMTKGPWYPERNSAFWEVNPQREHGDFSVPFTVADVCPSDPNHPDRGLQEANARAIALPPDLLDEVIALRAANARLREFYDAWEDIRSVGILRSTAEQDDRFNLARAALKETQA